MMPPLPPGIGEIDVHSGHGSIGEPLGKETFGIAVQRIGVFEAAAGNAGSRIASILLRDFDPQPVPREGSGSEPSPPDRDPLSVRRRLIAVGR
jgi:hypothetical protein